MFAPLAMLRSFTLIVTSPPRAVPLLVVVMAALVSSASEGAETVIVPPTPLPFGAMDAVVLFRPLLADMVTGPVEVITILPAGPPVQLGTPQLIPTGSGRPRWLVVVILEPPVRVRLPTLAVIPPPIPVVPFPFPPDVNVEIEEPPESVTPPVTSISTASGAPLAFPVVFATSA